jgi:Flp pilus assembly pilin Flp
MTFMYKRRSGQLGASTLEMGLIVGLIALVIIGSRQIMADRISASLALSDTSSTKPGSDLLFNAGEPPQTLNDSPGGIIWESVLD